MTHDQIREMVRRVNPIPDPRTLEIVDVPVLTTPLERRTEMQTTIECRDGGPGRPQSPAWSPGRDRGGGGDPDGGSGLLADQGRPARGHSPPRMRPCSPRDGDGPIDPGAYFVDTDGDEATSLGGTFVIEGSGWARDASRGAESMGEDGLVYR